MRALSSQNYSKSAKVLAVEKRMKSLLRPMLERGYMSKVDNLLYLRKSFPKFNRRMIKIAKVILRLTTIPIRYLNWKLEEQERATDHHQQGVVAKVIQVQELITLNLLLMTLVCSYTLTEKAEQRQGHQIMERVQVNITRIFQVQNAHSLLMMEQVKHLRM